VGAVYLRKVGPDKVHALNVVCPHAGCFVSYAPDRSGYLCPCHNSTFGLDGSLKDAASPSPRAMDELEVEVRGGKEVWVKFQNFRAGVAKKIPAA
jgi:Rieske Fe-S protein